MAFWEEFRQTFRVADAFDIALIAVFLYAVLLWFRTTASRNLAVGVIALAILYLAARFFDLYLTSLVFQGAFAVLLIVLVVVFQEDLRRMLERLATWGSLRPLRMADSPPEIDVLVEAAFSLAASKTGALMVLKGKEPLERHLHGGIALHGRPSKPLLFSIFDASSPGHDGAVVIDRDRVMMFAAHLPISKNQAEIRGRGTRHSAALGLSEQSDSMIIVVSEERGVVSTAEGGTMSECKSATALKGRIADFYEAHFPVVSPHPTRQFITRHLPTKLLALLLSVLSWFAIAYNPGTTQRTFAAEIEYRHVPEGLVVEQWARNEVRITLSGREVSFRFFDPASLRVAVDLSGRGVGAQEIPLTQKDVRTPPNLKIYRIEPRVLLVPLRKQDSEVVPQTPSKQPGGKKNGES